MSEKKKKPAEGHIFPVDDSYEGIMKLSRQVKDGCNSQRKFLCFAQRFMQFFQDGRLLFLDRCCELRGHEKRPSSTLFVKSRNPSPSQTRPFILFDL